MPQTTKATAKARPNSLSLSSFLGDEPTTYEVPRGGKAQKKKRIRISEVETEIEKGARRWPRITGMVTYGTITQRNEDARLRRMWCRPPCRLTSKIQRAFMSSSQKVPSPRINIGSVTIRISLVHLFACFPFCRLNRYARRKNQE